jgi:Protein of unknown function (DUF3750)
MDERRPPLNRQPNCLPRVLHRPALAGGWGGALGGAVAGGLGGAFGRCIEDLAPPPSDTLLSDFSIGAIVWGLVAGLAGALVCRALGAGRGARVTFLWPCAAAFWAVLAATVEAAQVGPLQGGLAFATGFVLLLGLFAAWNPIWRALRKARWVLVVWLALCLIGEGYSRLFPKSFTPVMTSPAGPVAQLWSGPLSSPLSWVARHHWLVTYDPAEGRWHRWEVWERADMGGTSWGHVYQDFMGPDAWHSAGPARAEREWHGREAEAIMRVLAASPDYPDRDRYLAWPGPNSNTYPAWVLRQAGVSADLDPRGIGRDYRGRVGAGRTTTRTGVQVESSLLGVKVGLEDGVELHFLYFTFGVDAWPPALKTPLGRVGFAK